MLLCLRRLRDEIMLLELTSRDPPLEQDVELLVRPATAFRQPEETPKKANKADAAEQEPSFPTPIALVAIQHIRNRHREDDGCRCLHSRPDCDGLGPQPGCRDLLDLFVSKNSFLSVVGVVLGGAFYELRHIAS